MIIIMKPNASEEAVGKIKNLIESKGRQQRDGGGRG